MTARAKRATDGSTVLFWCPGCSAAHSIVTPSWSWNGDEERPTFSPSVLVHPHQPLIDPRLEGDELTAPANVTTTPRCHSFVRDGRIQYLPDSTHELAGQTVDLPDWNETIR